MKVWLSGVASGIILIYFMALFLHQYLFLDLKVVRATTVVEKTDGTLTAMPFCSREQIQSGFWTTVSNSTNTTLRYRSTPWEETCYKDGKGYYESIWNVNELCELVQWDPELLCEILENKTLGFIGDSITWQVFQSTVRTYDWLVLITRINRKVSSSMIQKYLLESSSMIDQKSSVEFKACRNNFTTIFYSRDNKLNAHGVQKKIALYQLDIIVANRGAWYDPDEILLAQLQETIAVFQEWLDRNDDRLLIWRTTAPGIPRCETFPAPWPLFNNNSIIINNSSSSSILETMEQHVESLPWYMENEKRKTFHWWDFRAQNALVEDTLLHSFNNSMQLEFLDTYHWYIQQPDLHMGMVTTNGDCLHHCLPGVPDETTRLLLHILQRRRQRGHSFSSK